MTQPRLHSLQRDGQFVEVDIGISEVAMVPMVSAGGALGVLETSEIPDGRGAYSPASCFGPSPSLISARESGVIFDCQPLSVWYFTMAACVSASH